MIRHVWSVLCTKASIDRTTNNISLFEAIESVQFTTNAPLGFPAGVPFEGTLVTLWARRNPETPVTAKMRTRVLGPAGQELGSLMASIDLQRTTRTRNLTYLRGLRLAGNGIHEFEISWRLVDTDEWNIVASIPLDLSVQVDPTFGGKAILRPVQENPE